jgi:hypothetical protein
MLKSLIRTIDRWRFELPLSLVFGASAAFATIVMPADLFQRLPGVAASGHAEPIQNGVAGLVGLVALFAGYMAMRRPASAVPAPEIVEEEEIADPAIAERLVRLRRADLHPDAPPRQPIRASRDLGEPFMDVGGASELALDTDHAIPDGDYIELDGAPHDAPVERIASEAPLTEAAPVVEDPIAEAAPDLPSPIEAFEPEVVPMPAPGRAPRPSLSAMMERLSDGLERRGGRPMTPPPVAILAEALTRQRDSRPELKDALEELNRLAGRHH